MSLLATKLRFRSATLFATVCVFLISLALGGCRRQTAPERAYAQFVEALQEQDRTAAWKLLSQASQRRWSAIAKRYGAKSGKFLFTKGNLWRNRELRPNPKKPPAIKGKRATLSFFDELNQNVVVSLTKEKDGWRIELGGKMLSAKRRPPVREVRRAPAPRAASNAKRPTVPSKRATVPTRPTPRPTAATRRPPPRVKPRQ